MSGNLKERSGRGAIADGRPTPTVENYLKVMMKRSDPSGVISARTLATQIGVSGATVTSMLKHLDREGLARYTPYRGARLTKAGRTQALRVIRRHRLLERFLADIVGVPWDEVDAEAEALEHSLSERLEERIDTLLAHPRVDPHGDPIPPKRSLRVYQAKTLIKLIDAKRERRYVIKGVSDADSARLRVLGGIGIKLGTKIEVLASSSKERFDLRIDRRVERISRADAEAIFVDAGASGIQGEPAQ